MGSSRGWPAQGRTREPQKPHLDTSGDGVRLCVWLEFKALSLPEATWSSLGVNHPTFPQPFTARKAPAAVSSGLPLSCTPPQPPECLLGI